MTPHRSIVLALLAPLAGACASAGLGTLLNYSNPASLAGTWVDSSLATPTDTVAWVLGPRGLDQTLTRHRTPAGEWSERLDGYGYWYVVGRAERSDSGQICFRSRARGRDACFAYASRRAAGANTPERLVIYAYRGLHHTRDRILLRR